jgi:hypothetical protein
MDCLLYRCQTCGLVYAFPYSLETLPVRRGCICGGDAHAVDHLEAFYPVNRPPSPEIIARLEELKAKIDATVERLEDPLDVSFGR